MRRLDLNTHRFLSPWGRRHAQRFTLQWHLTNACELRCAHCYDRSVQEPQSARDCLSVLADFRAFSAANHFSPAVSLTGGNPLLHPGFWTIYRKIVRARIPVSILGNPLTSDQLDRLLSMGKPSYYQVSLEGRKDVNDAIRGAGHFDRTVEFLNIAKASRMVTNIMVTVHAGNIADVIPMAEELAPFVGRITFNRLAQVGQAVDLQIPSPVEYRRFLLDYLTAAKMNTALGMKDNLFNIIRQDQRLPLFGGCTGNGCGAAKNFVALLPNGDVHACRKFPSPIGNLRDSTLHDVYHSETARRYRQGPDACGSCVIRTACRGCMAVTAGHGGDPLTDRDPQCFADSRFRRDG